MPVALKVQPEAGKDVEATAVATTAVESDGIEVGGGDDSPGGRHYHSAIVQRTTENMQSITITWRPSAFARRTGTGRPAETRVEDNANDLSD